MTSRMTGKAIKEVFTMWWWWPFWNLHEQTSVLSIYLNTVSTFHLHFIPLFLHVVRWFWHSFSYCNKTFSAPLIARFIVRIHFLVLWVHAQCCVRLVQLFLPTIDFIYYNVCTVYMYKPYFWHLSHASAGIKDLAVSTYLSVLFPASIYQWLLVPDSLPVLFCELGQL